MNMFAQEKKVDSIKLFPSINIKELLFELFSLGFIYLEFISANAGW